MEEEISTVSPAKNEILNVRAEAVRQRTPLQRSIARVASILSNPFFFMGELILHVIWIVLNLELLPGMPAWDPYPFSFLTGLASVQALFIGLLILMYAEHDSHISDLREEVDLQVALHSERETSKVLRMLTEIHEALRVPSKEHDQELAKMSQPLDPADLTDTTERHISSAEKEG